MEKSAQEGLMFCIGQQVTHPMHGAGTINGMIEQRPDGRARMYYVLTPVRGGLELYIPCDGCEKAGLRPIMTPAEAEIFLHKLPELVVEASANWNQRYRENMERLKSGEPRQVAVVIKSLLQREQHKRLSTGERKMLNTAVQILVSELALAENCSVEAAEQMLTAALG